MKSSVHGFALELPASVSLFNLVFLARITMNSLGSFFRRANNKRTATQASQI